MENRYDKYKDSGIEWIGEIPEHWEVIKTKNSFNIISGATPKTDNIAYWDGEITWITPADYKTEDIIIKSGKRNITTEGLNSCGTSIVPQGSIIFSKRAPIGLVAINAVPLCTNQGCISCIPKPYVNTKYFYYLISVLTEWFELFGSGTTFKELSTNNFANFSLSQPSFTEQLSIATYLDQKCGEIDELITLQEEMITKLQSYKQSVITEAVTKGLDKNVPLKDSGIEWIGEIPEHWEVKRLKNVCSTNSASLSDKTSKEFEFDYVDIGSVSFELGIHKTEKYTFKNAPSRARKIARIGNIIVSTVRTYLRAIDIINSKEKEKYIYSTGFAILSPLKNILSEFMIYICRSEYFTNQVSIYSTGINYPSINDTALKMINIVNPPLPEQQTIADYLDKKCSEIDELITIKQQKIEKLKDYKKSLIFECVTGKRKVS